MIIIADIKPKAVFRLADGTDFVIEEIETHPKFGSYILPSSDDEGNDAGYFQLSGELKELNPKTGSRFGINETEKNLRKYLIGAVVADAEYMASESAKAYGWSKRPLIIRLFGKKEDDKVVVLTITPKKDTEGNNGGAILGQTADKKDLGFPTI